MSRWRSTERNPGDVWIRELERRAAAGDQEAWAALIAALRRAGDYEQASRLVYENMLASDEWLPWPVFDTGIGSIAAARRERNADLQLLIDMYEYAGEDPMIVVPHVMRAHADDTEFFTDGPYVVSIDVMRTTPRWGGDECEAHREMGGAQPSERAMIPIWHATKVLPPWAGAPQLAQGAIQSEGLWVDGPMISETKERTWRKSTHEWLVRREYLHGSFVPELYAEQHWLPG